MSLHKPEIRELIRFLRRRITPEYRAQSGVAAAEHFLKSPLFAKCRHLAAYLSLPDELDTGTLIQGAWDAEVPCYLPTLDESPEKILHFALYQENARLKFNRYQVLEPETITQIQAAAQLDVVLLPLLAFDDAGNRLGSGGGYYDRTFGFLLKPQEEQQHRPCLLGLGYELQRVDQIPREEFDVPLDGILTENGLKLFS